MGSPYSWCFLPHTPFSCCSPYCSFTLKSRISCDRLALLNGMGWEEQRPSCYDSFSSLCLPGAFLEKQPLKSNPKDTDKSDLNLILSVVFLFLILLLSSCGKQYTTEFSRSSLKVSPSLEFLSYWFNFLPAFELAFFCEMLFLSISRVNHVLSESFILLNQMGH